MWTLSYGCITLLFGKFSDFLSKNILLNCNPYQKLDLLKNKNGGKRFQGVGDGEQYTQSPMEALSIRHFLHQNLILVSFLDTKV